MVAPLTDQQRSKMLAQLMHEWLSKDLQLKLPRFEEPHARTWAFGAFLGVPRQNVCFQQRLMGSNFRLGEACITWAVKAGMAAWNRGTWKFWSPEIWNARNFEPLNGMATLKIWTLATLPVCRIL